MKYKNDDDQSNIENELETLIANSLNISKLEIITLSSALQAGFTYFPIKQKSSTPSEIKNSSRNSLDFQNNMSDNCPLFQSYLGYTLRVGLTIFESENIKKIKIIKRGLPKIYSINENSKPLRNNLFNFISNYYASNNNISLSVYSYVMLSEINVLISYENSSSSWVVSTTKRESVLFTSISDINELYKNKKIDYLLYLICDCWINICLNIEKRSMELYENFKNDCSYVTLVGFYCGYEGSLLKYYEEKKIVFYSIVDNMKNFTNFSQSKNEIESFYNKYKLEYEILKEEKNLQDIKNINDFKKSIENLLNTISNDLCLRQFRGSIYLILENKKIVSWFKILNHEMIFLTNIRNKLSNNYISYESIKNYVNDFSQIYKLPFTIDGYLKFIKNINTNREKKSFQQIGNEIEEGIINLGHPGLKVIIEFKNDEFEKENSNIKIHEFEIKTPTRKSINMNSSECFSVPKFNLSDANVNNLNESKDTCKYYAINDKKKRKKFSINNNILEIDKKLDSAAVYILNLPKNSFSKKNLINNDGNFIYRNSTKEFAYNNKLKSQENEDISSSMIKSPLGTPMINSINLKGKNKEKKVKKKVKFLDQLNGEPLVEIINVPCIKQFNLEHTYADQENSNLVNMNVAGDICCKII